MIDFARISVKAGDGGHGAGSFEHVKGKRRGKADGGDGGRGGDVYMVASADLSTLEPFRFIKEYKAQNGGLGSPKRCTGAQGSPLEIKVPAGTDIEISDAAGKLQTADLVVVGDKLLVARGGEGGRGNAHLRDELGRRPFRGEEGQLGERLELQLQLKLIADVGLVGLPNVGKSTLISKLTRAEVKIAPYPFTTLEPNLGVMSAFSYQSIASSAKAKNLNVKLLNARRPIVIADVPGLIEGASRGRGLGDLFLRHIERTKIIVHLIDATSVDVTGDWRTVRDELKAYSGDLVGKKEIVALNKIDALETDELEAKIGEFKKFRKKVYPISAIDGTGIDALVREILRRLP